MNIKAHLDNIQAAIEIIGKAVGFALAVAWTVSGDTHFLLLAIFVITVTRA